MSSSRGSARSSGGHRTSGRPWSRWGTLRLDPAQRRVWRGGDEVKLSAKAFALLEAFMRRPGEVVSRGQLLEAAWDIAFESRSNIVDVYVRALREQLGADTIETVRGVGLPPAHGHGVISRLPIRLRLALPFAVVMAALLAATGFLIYQRVGSELLSTVDRGLRAQSVEAAHHVSEGHGVLDRDAPEGPAVGQLVLGDGRIRESSPASAPALVSGSDLRAVLAGQTRLRSGGIRGARRRVADPRGARAGERRAGGDRAVGVACFPGPDPRPAPPGVPPRRARSRSRSPPSPATCWPRRPSGRWRRCAGGRPRSAPRRRAPGCRCPGAATRSRGSPRP